MELFDITSDTFEDTKSNWEERAPDKLERLRTEFMSDGGRFGHCNIHIGSLPAAGTDPFVPSVTVDSLMDSELLDIVIQFAKEWGKATEKEYERRNGDS